jgi:hypothetical protein
VGFTHEEEGLMRRSLVTASLLSLALAVLGSSVPARAGGWDTLRFRRDHYLVGEVARARAEFFAGALKDSGPLDGRTYNAYLLPSSGSEVFGMIFAPRIPAGAVPLGALQVEGPFTKAGGYPYGIASLDFTVPDVPSGDYAIGFCDDPCTHGTVGWLAWGYLRIVHTPLEGRLLRARDRAQARADALRRDLRDAERATAAVANRLATKLHAVRMALRVGTPVPGEPARAVNQDPSARSRGRALWPDALVWILGGAVAGGVIAHVLGRRRARRRDVTPAPGSHVAREREPEPAGV